MPYPSAAKPENRATKHPSWQDIPVMPYSPTAKPENPALTSSALSTTWPSNILIRMGKELEFAL